MKKIFKIFTILFIMLTPLTVVSANSSKIDEVIEKLKSSDAIKNINGTVEYSDGNIEISYYTTDTSNNEVSFPCEGNVIEYNPNEVTNYEEAETTLSHFIYATEMLSAALKLNGYTQNQIQEFLQSESSNFNFETNGFEIKEVGKTQSFTGGQYNSTLTVTPMSIKFDVSRVNLSTSSDDELNLKGNTIEDLIEYLKSDDDFIKLEDDGKIIFENEIEYEDNSILINHTYYSYNYHNISFLCEDGILTYEPGEIIDYYEAESASEHEMWALILLQYALEENGYTQKQIQDFFQSENSKFDFETNGIEIKEVGDEKTFTGGQYNSTLTVTPLSIKFDFEKANIGVVSEKYNILDGANQTFDLTKNNKLTFRFSIDYDTFVNEGKVFINDKEVSKDNYTLSKGSTIVTFKDEYIKTLSPGKYKFLASVGDGNVQTEFTISSNINNPQTGDNIMIYVLVLTISIISFVYIRNKNTI